MQKQMTIEYHAWLVYLAIGCFFVSLAVKAKGPPTLVGSEFIYTSKPNLTPKGLTMEGRTKTQ